MCIHLRTIWYDASSTVADEKTQSVHAFAQQLYTNMKARIISNAVCGRETPSLAHVHIDTGSAMPSRDCLHSHLDGLN